MKKYRNKITGEIVNAFDCGHIFIVEWNRFITGANFRNFEELTSH